MTISSGAASRDANASALAAAPASDTRRSRPVRGSETITSGVRMRASAPALAAVRTTKGARWPLTVPSWPSGPGSA
eukprot:14192930-Alexandrium_andersonii.AAC.1